MIQDCNKLFSPQEKEFGDFLLRNAGKNIPPEAETLLTETGALLFRAWCRGCYSLPLSSESYSILTKCTSVVSISHEKLITPLVIDEEQNIAIYRYFELENFIAQELCRLLNCGGDKIQIVCVDFDDADLQIKTILDEVKNSGRSAVLAMPDNRDRAKLLADFPEVEIRRFSEAKKANNPIPFARGTTLLISDCEHLTPEIFSHFLKLRDRDDKLILCGDSDNCVIPGFTHRFFASLLEAMPKLSRNEKKPDPLLDELKISTKTNCKNFSIFPYAELKNRLKNSAVQEDMLLVFPHQHGPLSAEAMFKTIFPGNFERQQQLIERSTTWLQLKKSSVADIKIILPLRDYDFLDFDHIQLLLNPVRQTVEVYGDPEIWDIAVNRKITPFSRTAAICKKALDQLY